VLEKVRKWRKGRENGEWTKFDDIGVICSRPWHTNTSVQGWTGFGDFTVIYVQAP